MRAKCTNSISSKFVLATRFTVPNQTTIAMNI